MLSQQSSVSAPGTRAAKDMRAEAQRIFQEGQTELNRGELEAAEAAFRRVLKLDASSASAHANLGVIEMRRKQWDKALLELHRAERLDPRMIGIHLNIGLWNSEGRTTRRQLRLRIGRQ